jgi:radical SAM superfamily enzyme YgiQ (UPF0313 family)
MKCALINPNIRGEMLPNTGLAYVASAIAMDHEVFVIDLAFHRSHWQTILKERLMQTNPDVIGISCLTFNHVEAIAVSKLAKEVIPRATIVFGGTHPTIMPEETLNNETVDAVCIGEGEVTFNEYLNALDAGKSCHGIEGIWYKHDGRVIKNDLRPWIQDLDSIAYPDWDQWEIERYLSLPTPLHKTIPLLASRGCPYECAFCVNQFLRDSIPGKYVRFRSAQNILDEIKRNQRRYSAKGFQIVSFIDDIFGMRKDIFYDFCSRYTGAGLDQDIAWLCNTRANLVDEQWVESAVNAGCFYLKVGIEAGDSYLRNKIYRKYLSTEEIKRCHRIMRNHDVLTQYNFILGGPGETRETLRETLKLLAELNPDVPVVTIFQPLPKTKILKTIKALGGSIDHDPFNDTPTFWFKSHIEMPHLTSKQIEAAKKRQHYYHFWAMVKKGLAMKPLVFCYDLIKFFVYIQRKYHLYPHHVYLYTVFKYQVQSWFRKRKLNITM